MTLKELLGHDANDIEKMSDQELYKILQPYIEKCRKPVEERGIVLKKPTPTKKERGPRLSGKQALIREIELMKKELENENA